MGRLALGAIALARAPAHVSRARRILALGGRGSVLGQQAASLPVAGELGHGSVLGQQPASLRVGEQT